MINDNFNSSNNQTIIVIDPFMPKVEDHLSHKNIKKFSKSIADVTKDELNKSLSSNWLINN